MKMEIERRNDDIRNRAVHLLKKVFEPFYAECVAAYARIGGDDPTEENVVREAVAHYVAARVLTHLTSAPLAVTGNTLACELAAQLANEWANLALDLEDLDSDEHRDDNLLVVLRGTELLRNPPLMDPSDVDEVMRTATHAQQGAQ